ncbi:radical SAM protein [Azospirillum formosense]|uniref:Radical SAM protein n=1 Tax=Azospirillum formosense TaxID=861533 RepID=A0ABX2KWL9_9PROT|nr:radical SAM protein [Azospirillum formosense]MBY3753878.1 radical SAM protein [Azospirillum formosense]NUB18620.1 radical SAM protein [Azospirillum formosense]
MINDRLDLAEVAAALDNKRLRLFLLPTEYCNFRCTYCYEDFALGRMSEGVVNSVKLFLKTRIPQLRSFSLSWFGGEPLAAKSLVLDITEFSRELAQQHSVAFHSDITTNGYALTQDLCRALLIAGLNHFQISLDGFEEDHDSTRKLANGRGTYQTIMRNLLEMRYNERDFSATIRVHYTDATLSRLPQFVTFLKDAFGADKRFNFFIKRVERLGGPNDASIKQIDIHHERRVLSAVADILGTVGDDEGCPVCYAATGNSLIIRSNGRISKCTVAFTDDRNDIGSINGDGTLQIDQERAAAWLDGLLAYDRNVAACPLIHLRPL